MLRIAVLLRENFRLELQAHKASFGRLRKVLRATSFIALWGRRLMLAPGGVWTIEEPDSVRSTQSALLIDLDPHLLILSDSFALPDALSLAGQLDLFSLPNVHGDEGIRARVRVSAPTLSGERRTT